MEKIDNIEKIVNSMSHKVNDLDIKVKHIEYRVSEVEGASSFISDKYEEQSKELAIAQAQVKSLQQ